MSKKGGVGKFVLGAGLGAGLALLFAPKKGSELREDLKNKLDELLKKAKEVDLEDVTDEFTKKVEELKKELKDLDKEKVLKIAKEKGEVLKDKAEDLLELAKEKGTPVLESIARDVKKSTASVIKEVLKKLETEEEK
mgnify:FL=1